MAQSQKLRGIVEALASNKRKFYQRAQAAFVVSLLMKENTGISLVILAAGMGSRFGRLKQFEPLGPHGEALMTYTIRDAYAAGIRSLIFIIRKELEEITQTYIAQQVPKEMQIMLVFQSIPEGYSKPAGTAHALWAARTVVKHAFILLNADDYYGADIFLPLITFLKEQQPKQAAMVPYPLGKTLSAYGSVNRGVCHLDTQGMLREIEETYGLDAKSAFSMDTPVSMNVWAFPIGIFEAMAPQVDAFFKYGQPNSEFQIPSLVMNLIKESDWRVKAVGEGKEWLGVTFPEDAIKVAARLKRKSL
jgi:choline kinase